MSSTFNSPLERFTIRSLLINGNDFSLAHELITADSFAWPSHKIMYRAMTSLYANNSDINHHTLKYELERSGKLKAIISDEPLNDGENFRGLEYIDYIINMDGDESSPESLAKQLQKTASLRYIIDISDKAKTMAMSGDEPDAILAQIELASGNIASRMGTSSSQIETSETVAKEVLDTILKASKGETKYIKTGLNAWDYHFGGVVRGRLYMIVANSGQGKSTLATSIVYKLAMEQPREKVGLISFEMQNAENGFRLIQMESGLDAMELEQGNVVLSSGKNQSNNSPSEILKIALKKLKDSTIYFDDSPTLTLSQVRSKVRKLAGEGCSTIIIDQLSQIRLDSGNDIGLNYSNNDIKMYYIKSLAREFDVAIIIPHQLKKSAGDIIYRKSAWAITLTDIAESGERAADVVVCPRHNGEGENRLIVLKGRQGRAGWSEIGWSDTHKMFVNTDNEHRTVPENLAYIEGYEN